ncbi:hypothetical protein I552_2576 [Mycobacterium xenopi 3993]|nr:hypothetical protein I552_2576 [Mycobacterium xenopi 3993]
MFTRTSPKGLSRWSTVAIPPRGTRTPLLKLAKFVGRQGKKFGLR